MSGSTTPDDECLDQRPDIYRSPCWPSAPVGDHFVLRIINTLASAAPPDPFFRLYPGSWNREKQARIKGVTHSEQPGVSPPVAGVISNGFRAWNEGLLCIVVEYRFNLPIPALNRLKPQAVRQRGHRNNSLARKDSTANRNQKNLQTTHSSKVTQWVNLTYTIRNNSKDPLLRRKPVILKKKGIGDVPIGGIVSIGEIPVSIAATLQVRYNYRRGIHSCPGTPGRFQIMPQRQ